MEIDVEQAQLAFVTLNTIQLDATRKQNNYIQIRILLAEDLVISTYSVTEANNLRLIQQLATKRNYKLINTNIVHSENTTIMNTVTNLISCRREYRCRMKFVVEAQFVEINRILIREVENMERKIVGKFQKRTKVFVLRILHSDFFSSFSFLFLFFYFFF